MLELTYLLTSSLGHVLTEVATTSSKLHGIDLSSPIQPDQKKVVS
jgi:hypothetical protein